MIQADQHLIIFTILILASFIGIIGERKNWFGVMSGVLVTILICAVLTTFGVLPSGSDPEISVKSYNFVFTYFVQLAIPLLLFNVQIKKIISESGRLLILFLIGSISVVVGALIAHFLIDLGPDSYKITGVFIGTYTGGSVNFVAVATALDFLNSPNFPTVIAVDNVFTNVFIMLLFLLPFVKKFSNIFPEYVEDKNLDQNKLDLQKSEHLLEDITASLLIAFAVVAFSNYLNPLIQNWLKTETDLTILIITILITIGANVFPVFLKKLESVAFDIGMFMLYVFLAVIGASCDIRSIISNAGDILLFASCILAIHLIIMLTAGKILKFSLKEIMVASAANVAGPSVSGPMAATFGMKKAVTPAILVAILGYIVGTFLGTGVGFFLG